MPLTLLPVPFLSDPNPKDKEQKPIAPAPSTRRAITLKLPIEVARALKDASANGKPGGQPAVRVTLNGDKPGLTISGQLFPFDLALKPTNGPNNVAELYSRTRHQYPRKPADHRPPLTLQSVIVGNAVVEDAAQKLRDRMAEAGQAKKDRRIQVLEMPPTTPGAGSKASAATTKKKKNAAARTATASTLERDVLRKGVAMKATAGAPAASSSMSAPSSSRASPSTINHKQPSSSTPTSPATSPVDTRPLEERIIHLLATKSQTIQELESLLLANKDDISEILRRVATTHDQSSTSGNWTSTPKGPWALKLSSYALLQPWTWPGYTDRDRKRIAGDMENAFDQSRLPPSAPERLSLQEGEAKWRKKQQAAKSASGTPAPGTAQRKLKMKKISEPPNATGGTLSASSVKQGMVKSTSANGVSTAPVKKKVPKADGTGSAKGSDVEMKEKPKKRPSPTETSGSGAATPMSASSSHGSISSGTSASAPLRHSLPQKPQVNLGPPSSATQQGRRASHTPPPPRPSATPTQSPRPTGSAASPRAAPTTSKRKHEDMSDLDDVVMSSKTKSARPTLPASSSSSSAPLEAKRRKLEPSPLGAGSSTAAVSRTTSTSTVANGVVAKTKHDESIREAPKASSSSQTHQNLKPPPNQTNGRPSQAPSRSASVVTAKSDRETASLPKFGKKEPSPLGPSALSKGVNGRDKVSSSARAEERSQSRASGKGRATPIFTSSEEEEDPEEAAEAARRAAAKKKKKLALAAAAAATPAASSPSNAPRLRKIKRLPSPLPTDRKELRLLHGEKYAEMMTAFAEIQAEKARAERCAAQQGDPSTLWSEDETRAKVNEYNTLHEQVAKIRGAVDASIRAEGQE
ncbi:hypothetical protein FRC00_010922 [Tulasnella sp. 408]|nr:hypothetical protein FRC00_010922 [Tulasnella sp. 408]